MSFSWIDRDRQRQELTSCKTIEDEAERLSDEIDRLMPLSLSTDLMIRDAARQSIRTASERLEQLHADLERWNAYADDSNEQAAAALVEQIDTLPTALGAAMLVVDLHDEHDGVLSETAGDPHARARIIAGPMTATQAAAIAAAGVRAPLPEDATYQQAKEWLDRQPRFARARSSDGGWFVWVDSEDHVLRLVDPLPIERELVALAGKLDAVRPRLVAHEERVSLYAAVLAANEHLARGLVLQSDLERFRREAAAREETEWSRYAVDWRSKRNKTS